MFIQRMKLLLALSIVGAITVSTASPVVAQCATCQSWTSSITYYTPSDTSGSMNVTYYDGTTTYTAGPLTLAPHKAGSLYIGSTSVPDGFAGSAVLSADVPIVATYVQFAKSPETGNYARMLYNAFDASQAGSTFYIPTVLRHQFGSTSRIGIQNAGNSAVTANLKFYSVGSTTPVVDINRVIQAYASYVFLASDITGLPDPFNGSLVISASAGNVVAAAEETDDSGRGAYAFEGVASGSTTIYLPSAMCQYNPEKQTSYYAIQNTSLTNVANVTIRYYNTSGAEVGTDSFSIQPGNKSSRNPCQVNVLVGALGSAKVESTGAPVIAIAKIKANNGMATAFVGQSAGFTKVAAPYIRWSANPTTEFRAYVAIMNVGGGDATNIVARYYDGNGNLAGTHTVANAANPLPRFTKRNTTPQAAGALDVNGNFGISPYGGAVEITSDQPIVVVVRMQKDVTGLGSTTRFAEDYNGIQAQ